ncbi:protein C2-DOMAIN ABA-RELATED 11-like [Cucumis melo var. makuwa]|uniref:Protein C2-DOMAIN ABA-RELATED 11-like n=2 Tax=Cucumis melo TaxID=3656 RepID=A0A5A7THM1_CUCMM|nr:protein C2-DOMAIN ABA-RELATED 11-like [Cucumis melo var. makuwa]TYK15442.1 protein C2-DOMAIN ABA-RELATED 11-like [Cucumis melo var. makuwa]
MAAEPSGSGRLKVIVVQGKNLVIRDFRSSDPYVVVKLGKQKAKTKVIKNNLNPVWNEELTFKIDAEPTGLLNFEVFDKDLFKRDDRMGRASINLQPMQSASRLSKILRMSTGETTLRKVVPGRDDCVAEEYSIRCIDGEVVQDVWLRLGGVESGEIQVRMKYVEE